MSEKPDWTVDLHLKSLDPQKGMGRFLERALAEGVRRGQDTAVFLETDPDGFSVRWVARFLSHDDPVPIRCTIYHTAEASADQATSPPEST